MNITIKELKNIEELLLCKINKKVIGQIPTECIKTQSRSIDDIDKLTFTVFKEYTRNGRKLINGVYEDILNERLICADGEYYVIKEISENKFKNTKEVVAYGYEKKLEKNNFTISNKGLSLMDNDTENNIYSFNDCLYNDTGWKLGYVEDSVRYMENGEIKVRIQEDTDTPYYTFITDTIADQFCCIPIFDRKNMLVHLYDDDSFGDDLKLVLSKDNYVKSLIKVSDSNSLVTRLKLKGNDEKCIVQDYTTTGYDYIENYSYFISTKEMSEELIEAIELFDKLTPNRLQRWKELTNRKIELTINLSTKEANELITNNLITQIKTLISAYESEATDTQEYDTSDLQNQLYDKEEELVLLGEEIKRIQTELNTIQTELDEINLLCRRETALDFNGKKIFTEELLNELKQFTYYDTYSDDSFIDGGEIIKTGEKILERKCKPTINFSIDVVNFLDRIIMQHGRKQWNGVLGLGDVIALYDKDKKTEEYIYFVGWTKDYQNESLTLEFSNKKTSSDNSKAIADLLRNAKINKKLIDTSKYTLNNIKLKRINEDYELMSNVDFEFTTPPIVNKNPVSNVTLNAELLHVDIGGIQTLLHTIEPSNATNQNVSWFSSDENIATVDGGIVTGISEGICKINVVTEDGNKVASCQINVGEAYKIEEDIPITSIQVEQGNYELNVNGEVYIIPTIEPSDATNKNVNYLSSNESIASVDKNGLVIGKKFGVCKITVISADNPLLYASVLITVNEIESDKIANLNKALIIGSNRVYDLNEMGMLANMTVDCEKDVSPSYFSKKVDNYPSNVTCVITMFGDVNPTSTGITEYKTLLSKLNEKYSNKKIYVIEELPLGVLYDPILNSYTSINTQIESFNATMESYCNGNNLVFIKLGGNLNLGNLLNTDYTTDGLHLNVLGCSYLYNNITSEILADINKEDDKTDDNNETKNPTTSDKRNKITARADEIVKMCKEGKAWYSQYNRTIDWNKKQVIKSSSETISSQGVRKSYSQPGKGMYGFDCSSLVGVCYQAAGYDFMKGLSCAAGTLQAMAKKHGATCWRYVDDKDLKKAKPGDIVMYANDSTTVTKSNMFTVRTHHTAIYMGDGYIAEARGYSTGIQKRKRPWTNKCFFMRIEELVEEDKNTTSSNSSSSSTDTSTKDATNCYNASGTKDGKKYIYKFTNCRMTCYGGNASKSASGIKMTAGKHVAAHNMPYGTKIYIPWLKGKFGNESGIVTVADTGGYCFDFDLYLGSSDSVAASKMGSPQWVDAYVVSWGDGRNASSFTDMVIVCKKYYNLSSFHSAWTTYMKYGGATINFWKFNSEDKYIKDQSWYKNL